MKRSFLVALSISALIFSVLSFGVELYVLWEHTGTLPSFVHGTGRLSSTGKVSFCINRQPSISFPCNTTLSQGQEFTCQLSMSDPNGDNLTAGVIEVGENTSFLNVSPSGFINVTPTNDDVGNHTMIFSADDGLGCDISVATVTILLQVSNVNDPPYLATPIGDVSFVQNTTFSAFFLNSFFADPDDDPLTYTSSIPPDISVEILGTSEVRFTSFVCLPDGELVTFTATDPGNLSADSNPVTVKVTCDFPQPTVQQSSSSTESSGGGGGGGGGCIPDWQCQDWFPCLPSGEQWRRCYDKAACAADRYLKRQCTYVGPPPACEENWLCSEWGNCFLNGTQYRTCQDLNGCGTEVLLPSTEQACVYIPTCNDGVQNGNETGVDCGGSCAACPLVQRPAPITESALSWWIVLMILLSILMTAGVVKYYQAEIARFLARLGFLVRREEIKDVLLSKEQRNMLFEHLLRFEERVASETPEDAYDDLAGLIREYAVEALGVRPESVPEEVLSACRRLGLQEQTTTLLYELFKKAEILEQEELVYDEYFVQFTVEELRTLVCLTSEYGMEEIARRIEEVPVTEEMSFFDELFVRMTNALRAVQFGQFDIAKREYVKLLGIYEPLDEDEREQVYPELVWAFSSVKFSSQVTGAKRIAKA